MLRWLVVAVSSGVLAACMTLSGNYRLEAYDDEGRPLSGSTSMVAEGGGIYAARNGMCRAFPGAVIRITDVSTGEELSAESPHQCRGQLREDRKPVLDDRERWDFDFDGRSWVVGNQGASDTQVLREYILEGEDIKSWSELVTSQYVVMSPSQPAYERIREMGGGGPYMVAIYEQSFAENCQSPYVGVIDSAPGNTILEWWHDGCGDYPPQHQIQRVLDTESGMSSLSYVKKTHRLEEDRREQWIELLRSASFAPD